MTLRQLIDRLEMLSNNGRNDHMEVQIQNAFDPFQNDFATNAFIDRYVSTNHEYDFILITTTEKDDNGIQ